VRLWHGQCCQVSLTPCLSATLGMKVGRRGIGCVVILMVLATVPIMRDAAIAKWRFRRAAAVGGAAVALLVVGATVAWRLLK